MTGTIVAAGGQTHANSRADMTPVIGRHILGSKAQALNTIDRIEDSLNPRPPTETEQDLGARRDEGIGGERLALIHGPQDRDAGLDRAVLARSPTDQGEDRAWPEFQDTSATIDDALRGRATKADPTLDLPLQPEKFDLSGHRAPPFGRGGVVKNGVPTAA